MTLKDRKQISNIPEFNTGSDYGFDKTSNYPSYGNVPNTKFNFFLNENGLSTLRFTDIGYQNPLDTIGKLSPNLNTDLPKIEPKYFDLPGNNKPDISNAGNIAGSAVSFVGSMANAYGSVKNENELIANAETHDVNVGGVTYLNIDSINLKQEMDSLHTGANTLKAAGSGAALGTSIGSIFPGAGTVIGGAIGAVAGGIAGAIGGIFRKNKLKDRIKLANISKDRINSFNRNGALSDVAQLNYYSKYGDSTQDVLYANKGKDLKQPIRL